MNLRSLTSLSYQRIKKRNKIYTNCSAYGDKMEIPKNFKQGDFVKYLFIKTSIDDIGKEYTNVRVLSSKLLKTKEHMKDSSKTKDKSEKEKAVNHRSDKETSRGSKKEKPR